MKELDEHGQPLNRNFNSRRLTIRTIDELIGLCKGIQADGIVHQDEALFLSKWLESSREVIDTWPANILAERIEHILSDGIVDENEKKDLFTLLSEITGYKPGREVINENTGEIIDNLTRAAALLPLDKPAPRIIYPDNTFCLTGKFFYGPREKCETEIISRGGQILSSPTLKTNFLIIGVLGSADWKHSTYGLKIKKAIDYREKGKPIKIVSEEHWVNSFK